MSLFYKNMITRNAVESRTTPNRDATFLDSYFLTVIVEPRKAEKEDLKLSQKLP